MAVRLEKAFGADRRQLLDMQSAYDRQKQLAGESVLAVRAFVPPFLSIKARQIEDWADKQIEARTHLSVLLRTLMHSTGIDLHRVDFPGFDNAQRPGNDGLVEAGAATPWIPEGKSYSSEVDLPTIKLLSPQVELAHEDALQGDMLRAMTLNGIIYCASLGYDPEPAVVALRAGALAAGLSGKGPAFVAVGDDLGDVVGAWSDLGGDIIRTRVNNEGSRVLE